MSGKRAKALRKKFESTFNLGGNSRDSPLYKKAWRKFKRPTFVSKAILGKKLCFGLLDKYSRMLEMKMYRFEEMRKKNELKLKGSELCKMQK